MCRPMRRGGIAACLAKLLLAGSFLPRSTQILPALEAADSDVAEFVDSPGSDADRERVYAYLALSTVAR